MKGSARVAWCQECVSNTFVVEAANVSFPPNESPPPSGSDSWHETAPTANEEEVQNPDSQEEEHMPSGIPEQDEEEEGGPEKDEAWVPEEEGGGHMNRLSSLSAILSN